MVQIIALDNGFGNAKCAFNGRVAYLQTAVSRPVSIGLAGTGMKSAGRGVHIVQFNGETFAVGTGSWYKGQPLTSMSYDSLVAPERMATFFATLSLIAEPQELILPITLVVGLPVPLLQDKLQAEVVLDTLRQLKGACLEFAVDEKNYSLKIEKVKYLAQPVGAYLNYFWDENLKMRAGVKGKEVAILDVGFNTLDLYVIKDKEVIDTYVGGAEVGVGHFLESLRQNGHDLVELDAQLRSGELVPTQEQLDSWVRKVMTVVKNQMPDLKRFATVIPVGGGVLVAGEKLRKSLVSKGANVTWSSEPITENVRGLEKYGRKYS